MPKKYTYATAGVDRKARAKSKQSLKLFKETYGFSKYGDIVTLPFGVIFPFENKYLDFIIEEVGTKVLVAQLADKYDTIGIDGVAMAVNDIIRSGATPMAIADNIDVQTSDPQLLNELLRGIKKGAEESNCIVPGGEIGNVPETLKGLSEDKAFNIFVASIGNLAKDRIIKGNDIKPGDIVIGLRSSGIHSNGITLARKVLFKQWGGKYDAFAVPDGFSRELVYEVLEPTQIYVKPLLKAAAKVRIKAAVHITGDAYLKFNRLMEFSKGIGFEFTNFKPHPIFQLIQQVSREARGEIPDEEMLKTFNMGWGFAIIVEKTDTEAAIDAIEKSGVEAEQIGRATLSKETVAHYKRKKILLRH